MKVISRKFYSLFVSNSRVNCGVGWYELNIVSSSIDFHFRGSTYTVIEVTFEKTYLRVAGIKNETFSFYSTRFAIVADIGLPIAVPKVFCRWKSCRRNMWTVKLILLF